MCITSSSLRQKMLPLLSTSRKRLCGAQGRVKCGILTLHMLRSQHPDLRRNKSYNLIKRFKCVVFCGFCGKKYSFIVFWSFFTIGFFCRGHGNLLILSFFLGLFESIFFGLLWVLFILNFPLSNFFSLFFIAMPLFFMKPWWSEIENFHGAFFLRVDGWNFCANF